MQRHFRVCHRGKEQLFFLVTLKIIYDLWCVKQPIIAKNKIKIATFPYFQAPLTPFHLPSVPLYNLSKLLKFLCKIYAHLSMCSAIY